MLVVVGLRVETDVVDDGVVVVVITCPQLTLLSEAIVVPSEHRAFLTKGE